MDSLKSRGLFDVSNKVVLVTGGSRGIGKMIASGFVANGAKVYISSRSAKDCDATAKELNATGPGSCISLPADLQSLEQVEKLMRDLSAKEDALHVLVNNAGATWGDDIDSFPDAAFTKVMTLNAQRVFTLIQKCLPLLRAAAARGGMNGDVYRDPARIINIGSVDALRPPIQETYAYSASKAALHHLSRHLAGRLGFEGITCNTLACGPFESKMMAHTLRTQGEVIKGMNPLQRIGTPEDVTGAAIFLASRAGSYVNGATITIDGGQIVAMRSMIPTAKL
ncbi:NAD(P)-binding protein [Daedalea quercina L-15889]|uniref:NAD(P)-binding protein n=1 Tax=Daedalea quercina L-15889 TaxID=1314783 RepID=A0A165QJ31_9APHY|nr:NAD(P)-binding protein [Daedalea quercina L-15889]